MFLRIKRSQLYFLILLLWGTFGALTAQELAPDINSQPKDVRAVAGTDITFQVDADGEEPLNYQWWFQSTSSQFTALATNSTLILSNAHSAAVGQYWVEVSNTWGTITSAVANLEILAPVEISQRSQWPPPWPEEIHDLVIEGQFAYCVAGEAGLIVIDVSDPTFPQVIGRSDTRGYAQGICVVGSTAYVADGTNGMVIANISDPNNPSIVGDISTAGACLGVTVAGDHAYLATGTNGVEIIHILDTSNPTQLGTHPIPSKNVERVYISNNLVYAVDTTGFQVINVSNPNSPFFVSEYRKAVVPIFRGLAIDSAFRDIYALRLELSPRSIVLERLSMFNPEIPTVRQTWNSYHWFSPFTGLWDVHLGEFGDPYILHDQSLTAFDWEENISVILITGVNASRFQLADSYAYIPDGFNGLKIWDLHPPLISRIGAYYFDDKPMLLTPDGFDVEVVGNMAYLAGGYSGLHLIDVSNPHAPFRSGGLRATEFDALMRKVLKIHVDGNEAYTYSSYAEDYDPTSNSSRFDIISGQDPENPIRIGWHHRVTDDFDIANSLLLAPEGTRLRITNLENPSAPTYLGEIDLGNKIHKVCKSGQLAFAAVESSGVMAIDISSLDQPKLLGQYPTLGARDLDVIGRLVFVADGNGGLVILNFDDPSLPVRLGGLRIPSAQVMNVKVLGSLVFLGTPQKGLFVVDSRDPTDPILVGQHLNSSPRGISLTHQLAYVAEAERGLAILEYTSADGVPPKIHIQPKSLMRSAGNSAEFNVAALGTAPLHYQWRHDETNQLSSESEWSLSLPNVELKHQGKYDVIISNDHGAITSAVVNLTVFSEPIITSDLQGISLASGQEATFQVSVLGEPPLTYYWWFNTTNLLSVSDHNQFTRTTARLSDMGSYHVVVSNAFGTVQSSSAFLRIVPAVDIETVSHWPTFRNGPASDLEIIGDVAYVTVREGGLAVFDITDPAHLKPIGGYFADDNAHAIEVFGNTAYLANGFGGLHVLNVAAPSRPVLLKEWPGISTINATSVSLAGSLAIIGHYDTRWYVFDVIEPTNPVYLSNFSAGSLPTSYANETLAIYNVWEDNRHHTRFLDISAIPSPPVILANFSTNGTPSNIAVQGGYAYVVYSGLLVILDISNPTNPQVHSTFPGMYSTTFWIQILGTNAYLIGEDGVQKINIQDPANPEHMQAWNRPSDRLLRSEFTYRIHSNETHLFVAERERGLQVYHLTQSGNLNQFAGYGTYGTTTALKVHGGFAYLGKDLLEPEFHIVDVSHPEKPALSASTTIAYSPVEISLKGNYAYLATASGLMIMDVRDPNNPRHIDTFDCGQGLTGMVIEGEIAYVTLGYYGLKILDLSDPVRPMITATYANGKKLKVLTVKDSIAYLSASDVIEILDVSDPSNINNLGNIKPPAGQNLFSLAGPHGLLADGHGLEVFDLSDYQSVKTLGRLNIPSWSNELESDETYAYLASGGLMVMDITLPSSPTLVGSYSHEVRFLNVELEGHYSFAIDDRNELIILSRSTSDPTNPIFTGQPMNQTVTQGEKATFTVTMNGSTPMSYQWYHNQTNILTGETNWFLHIKNTQPAQAGLYTVEVTNPYGATTSSPASLIILSQPIITKLDHANDRVHMRIAGLSMADIVIIQASSNLVDWQSIFMGSKTNNVMEFTGSINPTQKIQFYRVMAR